MTVTDPWADVRERLEAEELRLTSEPIGDLGREFDKVRRNLAEVGRTLIDDADALLAVVRQDLGDARSEWRQLAGTEKLEPFDEWLDYVHPDLAALPERLK